MINITVKLYATFRFNRFKEQTFSYPQATCCRQILDELAIAADEVGTLMINTQRSLPEQTLSDGDIVSIFPIVGGG